MILLLDKMKKLNFKKLYLKDYIENIIPEELEGYSLQFN